jgi:purine-binding chemotaxis protein CheW
MTEDLYLVARVGTTWIALSADRVEAVVRMPAIIPIPTAPASMPGMVAIRSRLLTLIDPAASVGEKAGEAPLAIILSLDGHGYAVAVQAVDDVVRLEQVGTYPGDLAKGWSALEPAMATQDGRVILVVEADRLIGLAGRIMRNAA